MHGSDPILPAFLIAQGQRDDVRLECRRDSLDDADVRRWAAEALGRSGDVSVPWENPGTGARGTVTPLASAYTQDGFTCRDFLASYVRKDSESWLQGDGCRIHQGRWEVRHMKPLQRP